MSTADAGRVRRRADAGARLDVVSRQLGHASIGATADVYGHDDPEAAREAAARLAALYNG